MLNPTKILDGSNFLSMGQDQADQDASEPMDRAIIFVLELTKMHLYEIKIDKVSCKSHTCIYLVCDYILLQQFGQFVDFSFKTISFS